MDAPVDAHDAEAEPRGVRVGQRGDVVGDAAGVMRPVAVMSGPHEVGDGCVGRQCTRRSELGDIEHVGFEHGGLLRSSGAAGSLPRRSRARDLDALDGGAIAGEVHAVDAVHRRQVDPPSVRCRRCAL